MSDKSRNARVEAAAQDMRSPLAGIESMIALLGQTRSQTDQDTLIAGLRSAAAHLRQLTAGMAPVAGAGRRPMPSAPMMPAQTPAQMVLADVARPFFTSLAARCKAARVAFSHASPADCAALIVADATAFRQMLESVADLALRCGAADVCLTMAADNSGSGAEAIGVTLTLTGKAAGAAPLQLASLVPVKALARRLGGVCRIDKDEAFARLDISVPAAGRRALAPAANFQPAASRSGGDAPLLIVDGDAAGGASMAKVLSHLGHESAAVTSAEAALAVLGDRVFSAVMVDLADATGGLALLTAMRRSGIDLPVIAVCARLLPETRRAASEAGASWMVEKPVTIHDLRQALIATGLRDPMLRQVQAA